MTFRTVVVLLACSVIQGRATDAFLRKQGEPGEALLNDLEALFGSGSLRKRLDRLESRLSPTFKSLPKWSRDHIAHSTARYALHRIFVDLHGWSITGLELTPDAANMSTLLGSGILREILPSHVETLFEQYVGNGGFCLRDLAILAAAIEHLVHDGQRSTLRKACEVLDLPTLGPMSEDDMMTLTSVYMALFLQGGNLELLKAPRKLLSRMHKQYPGWSSLLVFLADHRETFSFQQRDLSNPFKARESSLEVALQVVGLVADRFAHDHAELECQEIKEDLLAYERGDTGRIRLADFYRAGLNARFFYTETKEYLHAIGAIDDTDATVGPKLMIPNYVLAKSNCLAQTDIYGVCCINECEGLFGHLEAAFATPDVAPQRIAAFVSTLSTSTVQAPRNLSQTVLRRLDEIAFGNEGRVLLHGRLFAQWMHLAFPRECLYPHPTGTTSSLLPDEWSKHTGLRYKISRQSLEDHVTELERFLDLPGAISTTEEDGADTMWSIEEELFAEPMRPATGRMGLFIYNVSGVSAMVAVCGVAFAWARKLKPWSVGGDGKASERYFV